jgi:hypothetical protein
LVGRTSRNVEKGREAKSPCFACNAAFLMYVLTAIMINDVFSSHFFVPLSPQSFSTIVLEGKENTKRTKENYNISMLCPFVPSGFDREGFMNDCKMQIEKNLLKSLNQQCAQVSIYLDTIYFLLSRSGPRPVSKAFALKTGRFDAGISDKTGRLNRSRILARMSSWLTCMMSRRMREKKVECEI